ncbi:hypothetical protein P7M10_24545, partial [Vibrio parahaemolyticus]|nr:hypothetical protein [Vibrio parahaemolyticus]
MNKTKMMMMVVVVSVMMMMMMLLLLMISSRSPVGSPGALVRCKGVRRLSRFQMSDTNRVLRCLEATAVVTFPRLPAH